MPHRGDAASLGALRAALYIMKDAVDVLELLKVQHDELDDLIDRVERGDGDQVALFDELADKLAAHAKAEELVFYPLVMSDKTGALLHESVAQHLAIRRILAIMLHLDPEEDEAEFDMRLADLKQEVTHHAREEEEGRLFPILRGQLSSDQRGALGNEVLAMFEALLPTHPRNDVHEETVEAAPLPSV